MVLRCAAKLICVGMLLILTCVAAAGCGGGKGSTAGVPGLADEGGVAPAPPAILPRYDVVAQIEASTPPPGVDAELWMKLTTELVRVLELRASSQIEQHPPEGEQNSITDLALTEEGGNYSLAWTYVNVGDYNQDGLVSINDLTPIGQYYNVAYGDPEWEDAALADGNADGLITINDITPIGQNYLAYVEGYNVYGGYLEDGPWEAIDSVAFSSGVSASPLSFSCNVGVASYPTYRVVPYDGNANEGVGGTLGDGQPSPFFEYLTVTPDGGPLDTPTEVVFTVALNPLVGDTVTAEVVAVNENGDPTDVIGSLLDDGLEASGDEQEFDGVFSCKALMAAATSESTVEFRGRITYGTGDDERTVLSNIVEYLYYEEVTDQRWQEIATQIDDIHDQLRVLAGSMTKEEAAQQLAAELEDDPTLAAVGVTGSGMGVWWHTVDGFPCLATLIPVEEQAETSSVAALLTTPVDVIETGKAATCDRDDHRHTSSPHWSPNVIGNHEVYFWNGRVLHDKFPVDLTSADDYGELVNSLESNTCPKFRIFPQTDLMLAFDFSNMQDYGVVIIISSADTIYLGSPAAEQVLMATPLMWTHEKDAQVQLRIDAGDMAMGKFGEDGLRRVAVTPKWIEYKYTNSGWLANSIVYLNFGGSLYNDSLADALCKGGAAVVFGYGVWSTERERPFAKQWGNLLFDKLLEGKTAGEAFDEAWGTPPGPADRYFRSVGKKYWREVVVVKSQYRIIDLGVPDFADPEYAASLAFDVSDSGQVVGWCDTWEEERSAFVWMDGRMHTLPTPGKAYAEAYAVNMFGKIAGNYMSEPSLQHACCWTPHPTVPSLFILHDLDDGSSYDSRAVDINNNGRIVGQAHVIEDQELVVRPCAWKCPYWEGDDPQLTNLGVFGSPDMGGFDYGGEALAIDDTGLIIGWTTSFSADGDMQGMHSFSTALSGGLTRIEYEFVDYDGENTTIYHWPTMDVAGWRRIVGPNHLLKAYTDQPSEYSHGSLYQDGEMDSLLTDSDFQLLYADWETDWQKEEVNVVGTAIGGGGVVVVGHFGTLEGGTPADRAFILFPDRSPWWLDQLIPCNLDWQLLTATGVSYDRKATYVCGSGLHEGKQRAYLLVGGD